MAEVVQQYRIINPASLEDLTNQVNRVFASMADRSDSLDGRRGQPRFYAAAEGVAGTDSTELATVGQIPGVNPIVLQAVDAAWPIGSIFISMVATNPNTLLGVGTWTAFGSGRVLVSQNSADTDFDTAEETGGAKSYSLAAHTHSIAAHQHPAGTQVDNTLAGSTVQVKDASGGTLITGSDGSATIPTLMPYIVVYMWKRTA